MHRLLHSSIIITSITSLTVFFSSCTQETQNQLSRTLRNWTGDNGVLDVISEGKLMYRFIDIDKLSTAKETGQGSQARPYRFGYGVLDENMNFEIDENERRTYFEISDFSTSYVFYERAVSKPK